MTHVGHPLIGDAVYRQGRPGLGRATAEAQALIQGFPRQALHAYRLGLIHPVTGVQLNFEAQIPADLTKLIEKLERVDV